MEAHVRQTTSQERLLRFGTSSFSEKDWVGTFYPPGIKPTQYLEYYARRFDTVEIDSSYYGIPSASTVDSWVKKTPDDFIFSLKFPRAIVHGGEGPAPDPDIVLLPEKTYSLRDHFLELASRLGKRLGPLVLQFPYFNKSIFASADPFFARLHRFLEDLPPQFQYVVEIRNRYWLKPELAESLRRQNVCLALTDYLSMPLADEIEAKFDPVTTDFAYIRLIGNRKEIEALTTKWDHEVIDCQANLERWARFIDRMVKLRVKTFIYVNNHYAGYAPATLKRLAKLVWGEEWREVGQEEMDIPRLTQD
jgi:uncharacterized protein YecE (DUF72 family)